VFPIKHNNSNIPKLHIITYEVITDDEELQVVGFTHFADISLASPTHATIW
jgi:hypothetical protein